MGREVSVKAQNELQRLLVVTVSLPPPSPQSPSCQAAGGARPFAAQGPPAGHCEAAGGEGGACCQG